MSLDNVQAIDAIGVDNATGAVVLSIIDYWDWSDERPHLVALQEKLNAYFEFVESGQVLQSYPDATGRKLCIDLIMRHPLADAGVSLLEKATTIAKQLDIAITSRMHT